MNFDEYQGQAVKTNIYTDIRDAALGMASEAGEVAGKISKVYRDHNGDFTRVRREAIAYEIGDVLWGLAKLANDMKIPLSEIARMNIEKLRSRKERDKIGGSGDHR